MPFVGKTPEPKRAGNPPIRTMKSGSLRVFPGLRDQNDIQDTCFDFRKKMGWFQAR
jgi:hypothetical protein